MGLINNERVVGAQFAVVGELGQQNAVGHELDGTGLREGVVKPNLVPHQFTQGTVQFVSNALRHRTGCDAAGLGVANALPPASAQTQADLGELGGFARARLAGQYDHLMIADRRLDIGPPFADRELLRKMYLFRYRPFWRRRGSIHSGAAALGSSHATRDAESCPLPSWAARP